MWEAVMTVEHYRIPADKILVGSPSPPQYSPGEDKQWPSPVTSVPLPPEAEVEVSVRIHTPLAVTARTAGQLEIGDPLAWRVAVWVTHPERGRLACVGEVRVDAHTGEVLARQEDFRLLGAAANGVLGAAGGVG
jgi:hypothetical protein